MLTIRNAHRLLVGVVAILVIAPSPPTLGQTPPGQQKIRINFNTPKRPDSNPYYPPGLGIIARLNLGDKAAFAISFYQWAAGWGGLLLIASLLLFARWRERRMRRRS